VDSMYPTVELNASHEALVQGFQWAKEQALAYHRTGDPVGEWYEAALPGREAFCMRDVSHQANGAQILGLALANRNMLAKFAEHVAVSRDWCSYWEIDRYSQPAPVDYTDDTDFWYNLPANFDVLHCCYRQYLWTGDTTYLRDPIFRNFYSKTVNEYVEAWDRDGDGLLEQYPEFGRRGIASYYEGEAGRNCWMGGDLICAQVAAYRTYSLIMEHQGDAEGCSQYRRKADALQQHYNDHWWNEAETCFHSTRMQDRSFHTERHLEVNHLFPLYFGLVDDPHRIALTLDTIIRRYAGGVETRTYLPEILYAYDRCEAAFSELLALLHPDLHRREYPEVSFSAIGAIATGLMGLCADARACRLSTLPRLTPGVGWVEMTDIPIFVGRVDLKHMGQDETCVTNRTGKPFNWRARFLGAHATLWIDNEECAATIEECAHGPLQSWVEIQAESGKRYRVGISQGQYNKQKGLG
jgi:mannosylglycerate hydrolase MGH1-like protein